MKIKQFNRDNLPELRKEFKEAVKELEQRRGILFELGRITFGDSEARGKLSMLVQTPASQAQYFANGGNLIADPPEVIRFKNHCGIYGLTVSDLYRTFLMNGTRYKLAGMRVGHTKHYPFVGVGPGGGRYRFRAQSVIDGLAKFAAIDGTGFKGPKAY